MKNSYYLTTTLPYVNAAPHIGFALEIIQADAKARYKRLCGFEVFFNFGTDEHGKKIYEKALELDRDPKAYCDEYAVKFDNLKKALNISYNNFIRTTDEHHISACQEFWHRCQANGDIYKKLYKSKYCVGCELEKTDSELENGRCPLHPSLDIEIIEEENYFFRFSNYRDRLLKYYSENPEFVIPAYRQKEITEFVKNGLTDFSVSRLKSKMPWGIDVPGDTDHVMYVWFDALVNYISALGWPENQKNFNTWWPVTQFAGKDNLRQQSAIWQAMLMSAGLPNSKQIFIHGFITVNGQKISKSLGNVIDPYAIVDKYGTDAMRYYLLREIPAYNDGDFSEHRFKELYNADLANGLGNLVARVARLVSQTENVTQAVKPDFIRIIKEKIHTKYKKSLDMFRFDDALSYIWDLIKSADKLIDDNEPWKQTGSAKTKTINDAIVRIITIAVLLQPFIPASSEKIISQYCGNPITPQPPLFPRIK